MLGIRCKLRDNIPKTRGASYMLNEKVYANKLNLHSEGFRSGPHDQSLADDKGVVVVICDRNMCTELGRRSDNRK